MTYHFYLFVRKFPKLFNFSEGKEKSYLVELSIFKENAFYGLQKILLDNFPRNFYIWSAIVNGTCMQKIKIGHRAKFRAKSKCFPQILFPVRAILRSIELPVSLFWFIQLTRTSWCRLRARVQRKTLSVIVVFLNFSSILRIGPNKVNQNAFQWDWEIRGGPRAKDREMH